MNQKSCSEKLAFNSEAEAQNAATVAEFQHGNTSLKPYLCQHCGLWHLASKYD